MATIRDLPAITMLLQSVNLVPEESKIVGPIVVAKHNGDVIGSVALEIYGNAALLRSLAVAKFWQGKAVSSQLYERIVNYARKQGVSTLYLMTETIPAYFEKLGYSVISRDEFPEQLMSSVQFTKVCPKSAIAMRKKI